VGFCLTVNRDIDTQDLMFTMLTAFRSLFRIVVASLMIGRPVSIPASSEMMVRFGACGHERGATIQALILSMLTTFRSVASCLAATLEPQRPVLIAGIAAAVMIRFCVDTQLKFGTDFVSLHCLCKNDLWSSAASCRIAGVESFVSSGSSD
jgi:hypothetical protein